MKSSAWFNHVEIVVIHVDQRWNWFIGRFPLIEQYLDSSLELSILRKFSNSSCSLGVFFAVNATAISTDSRDIVFQHLLGFYDMAKCLYVMSICADTIWRSLTSIETCHKIARCSLEAKQQDIDCWTLLECLTRWLSDRLLGFKVTCGDTITASLSKSSLSNTRWLICLFGCLELLHCSTSNLLISP